MRSIDPDLLRREPAAALLDISVRHLDRLTTLGKIPQPFKYGRFRTWHQEHIDRPDRPDDYKFLADSEVSHGR
ncbi:hypothetical protein JL100_032600 (plasmid) [Skermanella mucosa]|uniref:helix-turn-helix transcriptional regulator n=1 Tax=Skermanella mucosa TaxID=1789672 RepID=UPI00192C38E2|nr:hypothetical protein [Skermanella mucosa]UEM24366.1 hypothetical protein JL100_032600 [Skermanella mucosa]